MDQYTAMIPTGILNRIWAEWIIESAIQAGIRYVGIAPGSRSTPLVLAVAHHSKLINHVHFDERGLGFWALGLAKATRQGVMVITTSGTAVGNLLPSVIEAHSSQIPLVIVSADRPGHFIGTGENQTISQHDLFNGFVATARSLPSPSSLSELPELAQSIFNIVQQSNQLQLPVHINVPFDEPLYDPSPSPLSLPAWPDFSQTTTTTTTTNTPHQANISSAVAALKKARNGIIVAGELPTPLDGAHLLHFSELTGWPIFPDILSGLRLKKHSNIAHFYSNALEKNHPIDPPDIILWFGHPIVSKPLLTWLKTLKCPIIRWTQQPLLNNPTIPSMISVHAPYSQINECGHPFKMAAPYPLSDVFYQSQPIQPNMSLDWIGQHLIDDYVPRNAVLFSSNSLPIRLLNTFATPLSQPPIITANRGVSGIDGIISSAIGFATGHNCPGVLFVGDLAALYDLNGLAQLKDCSVPIRIIILNNDGGGIFESLPIAKQTSHFDRFFKTPHGMTFLHAAAQFNLQYTPIRSLSDWNQHRNQPIQNHEIIEIILAR